MFKKIIIEQGEKILVYDQFGFISHKNTKGEFHRLDAPAIIGSEKYFPGYFCWYQNGERHREDGPAIIWGESYPDQNVSYCLKGVMFKNRESFLKQLGDKVIYIKDSPYLVDGRPIKQK